MRKRFVILLLLVLCYCLLTAQQKSITIMRCPVRTLNYETGLLNNATTDVITDVSGFTLISTHSGLQRFNGYTLETIEPVVEGRIYNINYPVYFFQLRNGNIWITIKEGIIEYNPVTGLFTKPVAYVSAFNSQFSIIPLKETLQGVWCLHEKLGIVLYDKSGKLKERLLGLDPSVIKNILNSQQLLFQNSIAFNDRYIFMNDADDKKIVEVDTKLRQVSTISFEKSATSIACDDSSLYVLNNGGVGIINITNRSIESVVSIRSFTKEPLMQGALYFTKNKRLIVSINTHLFFFQTNTLDIVEVTDLKKSPLLSAGYTLKVYADQFNRIWLLTNNDVKRIQDFEIPFQHFIYTNEPNNFVKCVYYDEEKHIVIAGCFNGGIELYDTLANPLWQRSLIAPSAKDVIAIEKLTNDRYLIVTFENGWQILTLSTRHVEPFHFANNIACRSELTRVNFSNNLFRINDSTVLVATANNVFACIFEGCALKSATPFFHQDMQGKITCACLTHDNALWTCTAKGNVYILKNGTIKTLNVPGSYVIRSIAEDGNHNIWIGTDKGLNIYNSAGNLQKQVSAFNGLSNDCIYSILPVAAKPAVFCSTNLGLSYVSMDGAIQNYSKEMGLQDNEFNTNAGVISRNGRFYFGGINGITAFYPSALSAIKDDPRLHITHLVVNDSALKPSLWSNDTLQLTYKQNRLRLDIAALGLLNTNEYVYKYRLIGFENNWQITNQPTGINYTLQPGNYVFQVMYFPALSANKVFKKEYVIMISPPFYTTWWFITGVIIVIIIVAVLAVKKYNQVKYKRRILHLEIQQTLQAEKERISRELHDDLGTTVNLVSYNASLLSEAQSPAELKQIEERIRSSSSDMLQSLRETVWTLKQENITTQDVWTRLKNFVAKLNDSYGSDITIKMQEGIVVDKELNYDKALNLIRILQEAINNAIKHGNCTMITCSKKVNRSGMIFIVSDNGQGFDVNNAFDGNGLQNMRQRAKQAQLHLNITTNANNGTVVSVKV